jgi:hypothetical protein
MAKVNYRLQKRQREEARKKVQLEKQARRGRVPDAPQAGAGPVDPPAVTSDDKPPTTR